MNSNDSIAMKENEVIPSSGIAGIKRRWLVEPSAVGSLDRFQRRAIRDIYVSTLHLCLRRIREARSRHKFMLCRVSPAYVNSSEPEAISVISALEYKSLALMLSGRIADKIRYDVAGGWLDVYAREKARMIFGIDGVTAGAEGYRPPGFARAEITGNADFCDVMFAVSDIDVNPAGAQREIDVISFSKSHPIR